MDTKTYEKKRGRVRKKVGELREAGSHPHLADGTTPGSSHGGSATDLHLSPGGVPGGTVDAFNLSPQDFRARTSSNASSLGGRPLSPIQSGVELDNNEVPPMSPLSWQHQPDSVSSPFKPDSLLPETLTESLAEMMVGESPFGPLPSDLPDMPMGSLQSQLSPNSGLSGLGGYNDTGGPSGINGLISGPPPPYPSQGTPQRQSPNQVSPQNRAAAAAQSMLNSLGGAPGPAQQQQSGLVSMNSNSTPMNSTNMGGGGGGGGAPLGSHFYQMSGGTIIQNDSGLFQHHDPNMGGVSWEKLGGAPSPSPGQ